MEHTFRGGASINHTTTGAGHSRAASRSSSRRRRPVPATMPPATTPSTPITPTPAGEASTTWGASFRGLEVRGRSSSSKNSRFDSDDDVIVLMFSCSAISSSCQSRKNKDTRAHVPFGSGRKTDTI